MKKAFRVVILLLSVLLCCATDAQAKVHSVTLTWTASTCSGCTIAGYKVFRETSAGAPSSPGTGRGCLLLNSALVTGTSYIDTTGIGGVTYWYVTAAVDSNGFQSGYSNEVSATFLANPTAPALSAPVAI